VVVAAVPGGVVQQVMLTGELSHVTVRLVIRIVPLFLTPCRLQVLPAAPELGEDVGAALQVVHGGEGGGGVGGVDVAIVGGVGQSVRLYLA